MIAESTIRRYEELLQMDLDQKAAAISVKRQQLADVQRLRSQLTEALERDLAIPDNLCRADELQSWTGWWNRRNRIVLELNEEELVIKSSIDHMELDILRVWRKKETILRLRLRQQERIAMRNRMRESRDEGEWIMAGQPHN